jgi:hypothetical protein
MNILKTRKTVQYYVWYNLANDWCSFIIGFVIALFYNPETVILREKIENDPKIMAVTVGILAFVSIVLLDCFGCSIDCCMVFYCEGCTPIIKN